MCMGHPTERAWSRQLIYRTSLGTGVSGLGSPRVMEFGLRETF
jgi:hypothetical protein